MFERSLFLLVALLLGNLLSLGQSAPFRGGLLTNETATLPEEVASCAKVAYMDMNAQEMFMIVRTCTGDVRIYRRAVGDPKFSLVARQVDFGNEYQLLSWAYPLFKEDFWSLPDMETRPDGFYFTLFKQTPSGTAVNAGEGGVYRIVGGKLQKILAPGDTITYSYNAGAQRSVQIESASMPFPKSDGGEFFFLKTSFVTSGARVMVDGIFARKGNMWTLVLPFQISPIPGTTAYGLGRVVAGYAINEALDGSISFLQGWRDLNGDHFEWMVFNPRTQTLNLVYRYGAPILGVVNDFPVPRTNTDTRQRYWRALTGPYGSRTDYVMPSPNPNFQQWKWIIGSSVSEYSTFAFDMRGMSEYMASYLLAKNITDRGSGIAVWDGNKLNYLFSNGDALPVGVRVTSIGNNFVNQNSFMPVSNCMFRFGTYKADATIESLQRYEKPCITDAVADSAQVILYGKNLSFAGYTPTILVDGVPVSGATITTDRISFPTTGIPSGTRKVQVTMANGQMYSNETSVSVPITTPPPAIVNVVTATFENRPIAPGALFTVNGNNHSSVISTPADLFRPGITVPIVKPGETFRLPTLLGGTRVLVNGREAPLSFSSCGLQSKDNPTDCQVNAQMPVSVTGTSVKLVIQRYSDINGQNLVATSPEFTVQIAPVSPVVFKKNDGLPILQIADRAYTLVGNDNPVKAGETLVGYATGFGITNPLLEDGLAAGNIPVPMAAKVQAWIKYIRSGQEEYAEMDIIPFASPEFAGVTQFNILRVPHVLPDMGTKVFCTIKVGEEYIDIEIPYANNAN